MATDNPWYGYRQIAVMCRRAGQAVTSRHAYRVTKDHGLLHKPPFLVTDNGPSFLARRFTSHLGDAYTRVRIRYRTPTQLGLLERSHRALQEEEIHWQLYDSPAHARTCIAAFRQRSNERRPHWALVPEGGGDPVTPRDVYVTGCCITVPNWQPWAVAAKAKLDAWLGRDLGKAVS